MNQKILVVGAGHGGLVAAIHLARNGNNVTVLEKLAREDLGWDWHDNFGFITFAKCELPEPSKDLYRPTPNYNFYSPNIKTRLSTTLKEEEREIKMERRDLYHILLTEADKVGVEILDQISVLGPIHKDNVIVGVKTADQEYFADLIIDSAGLWSPIRTQLSPKYEILQEPKRGEVFHTYRAYFDIQEPVDPDMPTFNVYFGFQGMRGIGWVCYRVENDGRKFADVLFGRIDPFQDGELEDLLGELRKIHPAVGHKVLRGGQSLKLAIRRVLPKFVGDNYIALGDSACMAKPLNGSGIEPAMISGKMLADHLKTLPSPSKDALVKYSTKDLWLVQVEFMREIGPTMYSVGLLKNYMLTIPWERVDIFFAKGMIQASDMEASITGRGINMTLLSLISRVMKGISQLPALLDLKKITKKMRNVAEDVRNIPEEYTYPDYLAWKQKINAPFVEFEQILQNSSAEKN